MTLQDLFFVSSHSLSTNPILVYCNKVDDCLNYVEVFNGRLSELWGNSLIHHEIAEIDMDNGVLRVYVL